MDLVSNIRYRVQIEQMLSDVGLDFLKGKTIVVAGATGMLGSCLVDALRVWNAENINGVHIVCLSRNTEKAKLRFSSLSDSGIMFLENDIFSEMLEADFDANFIVHAASNADPVSIANKPVDTLLANVIGTNHLLRYGMQHGMERFLFISSGEMYGQPNSSFDAFVPAYSGPLDYSDPRSCYPAGKRAAEVLCQSYIKQYGVDAVIARPCHLFGPTMGKHDSRAVSEFLRSAVKRENIVLKSLGELERSHCYVVDAVKALLLIIKRGKCGEAYNIADPQFQMEIREFAKRSAKAGEVNVRYEIPTMEEKAGYSKTMRAVLDASSLAKLGWKPGVSSYDAIKDTVEILRELKE